MKQATVRAADAAEVWIANGIETAMNRFNADPEKPKKPKKQAKDNEADSDGSSAANDNPNENSDNNIS